MRSRLACAAAVLAAGLIYLNALHNPFVYDDYRMVVGNRSIGDVTNLKAIVAYDMTRPITNLTYAIDQALWGAAPFGFHVTNVLLHMLNVALLFVVAWQAAEDSERRYPGTKYRIAPAIVAAVAAMLFAVHPIMTEAVGYISGRSDVLYGSLFLLAVLCGRRWMRGGGIGWAVLTIALWGTGLLTKETAAMLPFVLFAWGRTLMGGTPAEKQRRMLMVQAPLLGMAVAAGLMRVVVLARVEYPGQIAIHWEYIFIALDVIRRLVLLILNPAGQSIFHEISPIGLLDVRALSSLALLGGLLAIAWAARRRAAVATFGILFFFLLLGPSFVLTVLDRGEPMSEHRVYLASGGFFVAIGAAAGLVNTTLERINPRMRRLAIAGAVVVASSLAVQTMLRNVVWNDPVSLWAEAVSLSPTHYRPHLLLGEALQDAERYDAALDEFQTVVRLRPQEPAGYMKLGLLFAAMRRLDDAQATFESLELMDPASASARVGLGAVAMLSDDPVSARKHFVKAIERDPRNISARQSLARLNEMDPANPAEALRLCREIQGIDPGTPGNDECIGRNQTRLAAASSGR